MATATAPIKVDAATDELVSHAAHFMSRSKKDIVDAAVREYIDAHRGEINAGIKAALASSTAPMPLLVADDRPQRRRTRRPRRPAEVADSSPPLDGSDLAARFATWLGTGRRAPNEALPRRSAVELPDLGVRWKRSISRSSRAPRRSPSSGTQAARSASSRSPTASGSRSRPATIAPP